MDDTRMARTDPPRLIAAVGALVAYFLVQLGTGILLGIAYALAHAGTGGLAHAQALLREPNTRFVLTIIVLPVSCVLSILIFRAWFGRQWRSTGPTGIGLRPIPWSKAVLGLLLGMCVVYIGGVLTQLVSRGHVPTQDIATILQNAPVAWRIVLALSAVTLVPLAEEILFRGIMLPALLRHLPVAAAITVDAGLFALVHLPDFDWHPQGLLALGLVGAVCCWQRLKTGSVFSSVAVHAGNNLLAMLVLFLPRHLG